MPEMRTVKVEDAKQLLGHEELQNLPFINNPAAVDGNEMLLSLVHIKNLALAKWQCNDAITLPIETYEARFIELTKRLLQQVELGAFLIGFISSPAAIPMNCFSKGSFCFSATAKALAQQQRENCIIPAEVERLMALQNKRADWAGEQSKVPDKKEQLMDRDLELDMDGELLIAEK
jgi:hypothetical protein